VPVRESKLTRLGFDRFSAKANLGSLSPAQRALAFHPEDPVFDVVVEAADAMPKRSGPSSTFVILEHFYDKASLGPWLKPGAWGCERKGAASQSADVFALPGWPRTTVGLLNAFYRSA